LSAPPTDRSVTLRSFLAAGALNRRPFHPRFAGKSRRQGFLRKLAAISKLAAIFTQLSGALSQILSRGR
jgi:hypothetical protein